MSKAGQILEKFKQQNKELNESNTSKLYIQASKAIMDAMKYLHKAKSEDKDFATKYHDQLVDIYDAVLAKGKEQD